MKKLLAISLIPVFSFLILGAFAALPAHAQGPTEGCTLVRDVSVNIHVPGDDNNIRIVHEDSRVVSATTSNDLVKITDEAGGPPKKPTKVADGQLSKLSEKWATICIVNTVNSIVDWIFILLLVVSVGLIAVAGFMFMTAGADAEKQKTAGGMIRAAIIGIVIAILARVVPALVTGILL